MNVPHNLEAERGVLGACLLDNRAIDEVADLIGPGDFFRDTHEVLFRAILEVREQGKPADFVTVADHLIRLGEFDKLGGDDFLTEVSNSVPHAANAKYHADVVRQKSQIRQVIEAASETLKECYELQHTSEEIVERAEERMLKINAKEVGRIGMGVKELMDNSMTAIHMRGEGHTEGIPTGLPDLDEVLCGLRASQLVIVAARPSMGKAQPLDAKVLTPQGFDTMGGIGVGDEVIGSEGKPVKVVGVYPQGELDVYRVTMRDGSSTECCDDHLWFTQTRNERRRGCLGSVKPLREIRATLLRNDGGCSPNHTVPVVKPIEFAPIDDPLRIDPYVLGLLLGDGSLGRTIQFSNPEGDIWTNLQKRLPCTDAISVPRDGLNCRISNVSLRRSISATSEAIESYGLDRADSYTKFIPKRFLYASVDERIELLRGLMDTDGSVRFGGQSMEYTTSSMQLAKDVEFLARSLGGIVKTSVRVPVYSYKGEKKKGADSVRMYITFPNRLIPVRSVKHLAKWDSREMRYRQTIVSVEYVGKKPCQCIKVDSPDHLYVTDDFILTHNTAFGMNLARRVADRHRVLFVSIEMNSDELGERLISSESTLDSMKLKKPRYLGSKDWVELSNAAHVLSGINLEIDEAVNRTVSQIAAKGRRMKTRGGLGLVVIDYLGLIDGQRQKGESREQEVSRISRRLKIMAKELRVPVVALHQLNRQSEHRDGHRPRLSDLRDSGAVEQDADVVILLHRPEYYDANDQPGIAEAIVAKNRNGATGTVKLMFLKYCTRFDTLARGNEF